MKFFYFQIDVGQSSSQLPSPYDDELMQQRYQRFLQESKLPPSFGYQTCRESSDSESSEDWNAEDLEEWIKISMNIIDSRDESGEEGPEPPTEKFECDLCGQVSGRKDNLVLHLWQKHTCKYPCTKCDKHFITVKDLDQHLETHKGENCAIL